MVIVALVLARGRANDDVFARLNVVGFAAGQPLTKIQHLHGVAIVVATGFAFSSGSLSILCAMKCARRYNDVRPSVQCRVYSYFSFTLPSFVTKA